ncbi:MAG: hypothetical protein ACK47B_15460 [Armatimonadota bacterium]
MLELGDVNALAQAVHEQPWPAARLVAVYRKVYGGGVKQRIADFQQHRREAELLDRLKSGAGQLKGRTFEFRGRDYPLTSADALRDAVQKDLDDDRRWLEQLDSEVFQAHYQMARQLGDGSERELWGRYLFQVEAQQVFVALTEQRMRLEFLVGHLQATGGNLSQDDLARMSLLLREIRAGVERAVQTAAGLVIPPIEGHPSGHTPLGAALSSGGVVPDLGPGRPLTGDWIRQLHDQLSSMQGRSQQIQAKSLEALLAVQERISLAWRRRAAGAVDGAGASAA